MSGRRRKKRKSRFFLKLIKSRSFWLALVGAGMLAGLAYLFFVSHVFEVQELDVSGNEEVKEGAILQAAEGSIEKRVGVGPFTIFITKSIFLVGPSQLEDVLMRLSPHIGRVEVSKKLPGTIKLEIEERQPFAEICILSGECYKADKKGIVFEKSADVKKQAEADVEVFQVERADLVIRVRESTRYELGKEAVQPLYLLGVKQVREKIKNNSRIEAGELLLEEDKLVVSTLRGLKLYFDLDKDIDDQLFNLDLVLREKITDEKLEELEYIDLRFGNRIYYK